MLQINNSENDHHFKMKKLIKLHINFFTNKQLQKTNFLVDAHNTEVACNFIFKYFLK